MGDSVPVAASVTGVATTVAAVVLAAGEGTRLRPLTLLRPKPLCPIANQPLVDLAINRVIPACASVAVNVHHGRDQLEPHLRDRGDVWVSVEEDRALGTAGALGFLRDWLDGRGALVVNADSWSLPDLARFVAGWDGERVRMLLAGDDPFGPRSAVVASLLPWAEVARLEPVPSGLWEACWRDLVRRDAIETVAYDGPFVDCGTPARYLEANLWAAALATGSSAEATTLTPTGGANGGFATIDPARRAGAGSLIHPTAVVEPGASVVSSVIGPGATVAGRVRDSVVWAGTTVHRREVLDCAIRAGARMTILVR